MASLIRFLWAKLAAINRCIADYLGKIGRPRPQKELKTRLYVKQVIQLIRNEDWAGLRSQFIAPVRFLITESLLDKGWKIVPKAFGPLQSLGEFSIISGWLVTTIKLPLIFEDNTEFGMLLHLISVGGRYNKLMGLRCLSLHELGIGGGWSTPFYAVEHQDSGAPLHESEIILGQGHRKVGGTFCLPAHPTTSEEGAKGKKIFPCIIFLAGSGPCDRDSTVGENKPFKDLAWGLARRGIASIRFDKVTRVHAKYFRKHKTTFTLTDEYVEHTVDAVIQAQRHPNINPERVFVLGHSLGAVIAPMIAATSDGSVAGCIIMAGPAEPIYRCLIRQLRYIQSLNGPETLYLSKMITEAKTKAEFVDSDKLTLSTPAKRLPFGLGPSYWLDYRKFEPIQTAKGLTKPIFILQGGRDYQVTVQDDYQRWRASLHERQNVNFRLYGNLNHLFIPGSRPSTPLEYSVSGNVDEKVVIDIAKWVLAQ